MLTFPVASTKYNVKESAWHADNYKTRIKIKLIHNEDTSVHVSGICSIKILPDNLLAICFSTWQFS